MNVLKDFWQRFKALILIGLMVLMALLFMGLVGYHRSRQNANERMAAAATDQTKATGWHHELEATRQHYQRKANKHTDLAVMAKQVLTLSEQNIRNLGSERTADLVKKWNSK